MRAPSRRSPDEIRCRDCGASSGSPCVSKRRKGSRPRGAPMATFHIWRRWDVREPCRCRECGSKEVPFGAYCQPCRSRRNRASLKRSVARHREKNRHKHAANRAVHQAIKSGRLVRPDTCSRCKRAAYVGDKIHAHHWSYAPEHWLDVVWLCLNCHFRGHSRIRRLESERRPTSRPKRAAGGRS